MALYPANFIDDLKHQADIVVVIQDYVSLKKNGANYKGLCPFHGEKTPSFQVNRDKGFFHCFGCGAGGDVIKFLQLHSEAVAIRISYKDLHLFISGHTNQQVADSFFIQFFKNVVQEEEGR